MFRPEASSALSRTTDMRYHGTFQAVFTSLLLQVAAQSSNVTACTPLYEWTLNSNNQTPCLVAAFLESVCEGPVEVNTLPPGNHYVGPSLSNADPCRCSTVTYSLISACALCQSVNRTFLTWTTWAQNCSEVEVAHYLQPIPDQVVVPSWAYLDVTQTNNIFNPILANETLPNPSSSTLSSASTTSITPSLSTSTSTSTMPTVSPTVAEVRKKSNAGAIAGGIVGGLAGLVAISLLTVFLRRRRRKPIVEESVYNPSSFSASPTPMHESSSRRTAPSPQSITPFPYHSVIRRPSGSDTTPGSPPTSTIHTTFDAASEITPAVRVLRRFSGSMEA